VPDIDIDGGALGVGAPEESPFSTSAAFLFTSEILLLWKGSASTGSKHSSKEGRRSVFLENAFVVEPQEEACCFVQ